MLINAIDNVINVFKNADKLYNVILVNYIALVSTQRQILDYNRNQLSKGLKSTGELIKPFYASLNYKGRRSPVDLKQEGDFYKSFKLTAIKGSDVFLYIYATDSKTERLQEKYGNAILGLTDRNVDRFAEDFKEHFLLEIRKIITNQISR